MAIGFPSDGRADGRADARADARADSLFRDRADAGRQLAEQLASYLAESGEPVADSARESYLVLGLPRGGVVVADVVARRLGLPLDIWVVRKVGAPGQPELGLGAVSEGGELFLNPALVAAVGASPAALDDEVRHQLTRVRHCVEGFRRGRPAPVISDRTVLLIDDGIATGGTARVAARALRRRGARRVILAVPVAAGDTLEALRPEADDLVCLQVDQNLGAVSAWYVDFAQTTDQEVRKILDQAYKQPYG